MLAETLSRQVVYDHGVGFDDPEAIYAVNRERVEDEIRRLRSADDRLDDHARRRLALYDQLTDLRKQVLFFDPEGDGRISVVEGDLRTAAHVAVTVPGISNDLERYADLMSAAERLHGQVRNAAVISWLGYDAPVGVGLRVVRMVREIADDDLARDGAGALCQFVTGLRDTRPDASITVIGHSYGSLVVGLAARSGLAVNRVVFLGSPGVGADHVTEFVLPDGAVVYAACTSALQETGLKGIKIGSFDPGALFDDYVTDIGEYLKPFGAVPTDPAFGARVVDVGPGSTPWGSHSEYFNAGTRSLAVLAKIIEGLDPD